MGPTLVPFAPWQPPACATTTATEPSSPRPGLPPRAGPPRHLTRALQTGNWTSAPCCPWHSCRSARAVESFAAGNGGDASVCLGIPFGPWMAAGFVAYARSLWRPTWSRSDLTCERRSIYVSARCRHAHRDPRHPLWQLRCAPPATGTRRRDAHLQLLQRGYLARTHLAEETSSTQAPAHCARNA
ncbi:MAG: hypothetical protein BWY17_02724 [Deltaproteobacteria bacterium ADurb.Bin207]|nr:MAG: hypothetical protein BWY17_02724 [Deltaproteobacteria bacterium ADurb.Bin207]